MQKLRPDQKLQPRHPGCTREKQNPKSQPRSQTSQSVEEILRQRQMKSQNPAGRKSLRLADTSMTVAFDPESRSSEGCFPLAKPSDSKLLHCERSRPDCRHEGGHDSRHEGGHDHDRPVPHDPYTWPDMSQWPEKPGPVAWIMEPKDFLLPESLCKHSDETPFSFQQKKEGLLYLLDFQYFVRNGEDLSTGELKLSQTTADFVRKWGFIPRTFTTHRSMDWHTVDFARQRLMRP